MRCLTAAARRGGAIPGIPVTDLVTKSEPAGAGQLRYVRCADAAGEGPPS